MPHAWLARFGTNLICETHKECCKRKSAVQQPEWLEIRNDKKTRTEMLDCTQRAPHGDETMLDCTQYHAPHEYHAPHGEKRFDLVPTAPHLIQDFNDFNFWRVPLKPKRSCGVSENFGPPDNALKKSRHNGEENDEMVTDGTPSRKRLRE